MVVAVSLMPCDISMSYWQPHNSGKGVPGAEQEGSTEGHCPPGPSPCSLSKATVPADPAATAQPLRAEGCVCSGTTVSPRVYGRPLLNLELA